MRWSHCFCSWLGFRDVANDDVVDDVVSDDVVAVGVCVAADHYGQSPGFPIAATTVIIADVVLVDLRNVVLTALDATTLVTDNVPPCQRKVAVSRW